MLRVMKMLKKIWKIKELNINITPVTLSYNDSDGNNHELELNTNNISYSFRRYYDWSFIDHLNALKDEVIQINFGYWFALNRDRLCRIYRALDEVYNPIENYDKHGKIVTTSSETANDKDIMAERSASTTPSSVTTNLKERSSDSSQLATTNTSETSATNTTSTSEAYTDNHEHSRNNTTTITDSTHGNIGTMLSASAIEEEFKVREKSLIDMIVSDFVEENAFYIMEDLF